MRQARKTQNTEDTEEDTENGGEPQISVVRAAFGWRHFVRFFRQWLSRLLVVTAVIGVSLVFPQHLAWGAPATRTQQFESVEPGRIVSVSFPTTHVVVGWEGDPDAVVVVRGQQSNGEWGPWKPALSDDLSYGEQEGMVIVDDAVALQVMAQSGAATNLSLMAIDAENGPRHLELQSAQVPAHALNGFTGQPPIISRSQWGADESLRQGGQDFATISRVTMHHTVTDNNDPDPEATVRAIYAWHTGGNGWSDIGYNFLIDQQGRIYEGRYARTYGVGEAPTGEDVHGKGVVGAHSLNNNEGNVGIALLGTFNTARPTDAQVESISKLIAWEGDRHNLDLTAPGVVIGHRDVRQTECPGSAAYSLLPQIRDRANTLKYLAYPPGNTPGYWVAARNGGVNAFGSAVDHGSMAGRSLNGPIASMTRTASGGGYWLMGNDGGIFSFGDAAFYGSMGGHRLNQPVVGLAPTPSGKGYWLVASDGGIFSFGDAQFYGSTGSMKLNQPVVTISRTPNSDGYWLVARDGGVFTFGAAGFKGSIPMLRLPNFAGVVQATSTATGDGYYVLSADGGVYSFGDARFWGGGASGSQAAGMALVPE